jgi:beta-glucosidase
MESRFPSTFAFGVADADLQVIGESLAREGEQSCETMWHHFAENSGKCHQSQTPGEGVNRYHLWREDLELMASMGVKHYRTSVSMSRILKEDGTINGKAVLWYRNYFSALRDRGIKVYATLYHWELPQYLHAQGGWKNRRTIDTFVKHSLAVQQELGDLIEEYFILNEPWCSSLLSYHLGIHAPGEKNLRSALEAAHHLLLAQGVVAAELSAKQPGAKIGTVINTQPSYAATTSAADAKAARLADGYFNSWFLDPMFLGVYPEHMLELYEHHMPSVGRGDLETMRVGGRLHALGINYYAGDTVCFDASEERNYKSVVFENRPKNDLGWPVYVPPNYPEGLYDMLSQIYYSYRAHGLPKLYITENGMAEKTGPETASSTVVNDDRRVAYFRAHLEQVHKAIRRGIPVEAYFLWTLMDNYEWAEGYRPESCFGIVHVDRKTMKRTRKKSSHFYERVLREGLIPEA